jgi:hypothetical protein
VFDGISARAVCLRTESLARTDLDGCLEKPVRIFIGVLAN